MKPPHLIALPALLAYLVCVGRLDLSLVDADECRCCAGLGGKSSDDVGDFADLAFFVTHKLDDHWKLQGYALAGLINASPDFGLGGIVSYVF